MKQDRNWLQAFIQDNVWSLLVLIVGMSIFYANISAKVQANEDRIQENSDRLVSMQILVERVIVLEERENNIEADIAEIKQDLREIKSLVK